MEDDSPFGFSDDLIDTSNVKIKENKPACPITLEEWICRQNRTALINWISQKNQEKIQKYLSYDWNNPSNRVKQYMEGLLREQSDSPIFKICVMGDPTNGKLLQVLLNCKEPCGAGKLILQARRFMVYLPFELL